MTSDSTIVSVKLCPEVGNDEYIVLRNCGGRRMIGFELIEGGLWRLPSSHLGRSKQKKRPFWIRLIDPSWLGSLLLLLATSENQNIKLCLHSVGLIFTTLRTMCVCLRPKWKSPLWMNIFWREWRASTWLLGNALRKAPAYNFKPLMIWPLKLHWTMYSSFTAPRHIVEDIDRIPLLSILVFPSK